MRVFQIVLFVFAMVIATTQTFRHVYVKWIEPTDSVLDRFATGVDADILEAKTLEELVTLYAAANGKVRKYEANPENPHIEEQERWSTPPYDAEHKLKEEIEKREERKRELFKLCFYWASGLVSILVGIWFFGRINPWLGISGLIVGFSEMLYWTSPLVFSRWEGKEFELLLNVKLLLALCTWVLLVSLWLMVARRRILVSDG